MSELRGKLLRREPLARHTSWRVGGPAELPAGWDELAMDPREVDIVYVYPWPGEEEAVVDVFESIAADQALLVTFHGRDGLRVRRQRR